MSDFIVRQATTEELPEIGRLTVEVYRGDGYLSPESTYATRLADAAARFREAELLVAVDAEGTVLGTVTIARPGSPWVDVAGPDELEFRMLAVSRAARGRGIGEALVRAVIDRAAELGLSGVVLSSQQDMANAHRLYDRFGFYRTPERDWPVASGVLVTYRLDL
jgi:ribosomal protein S18 acetylase RimI-like enzyme